MSKNKLLRFKLAGIIGYGFLINHAGIQQYSVAWPHREAERFSLTEAESRGFVVEEAEPEATLDETQSDGEATAELHKHYELAIQNTVEGLQKEFASSLDLKEERIKFLEDELARLQSIPSNPNDPTPNDPSSTGSNIDETLTSFGLSANALKALHSAGIETKSQVIEYLKQHGSLEPIPGIAAKSEEAILKGLEIDKEALLQPNLEAATTAS